MDITTPIIELSASTFLIVCPFLFLAGLVDAIGGGGGLISLPPILSRDFLLIWRLPPIRCLPPAEPRLPQYVL